MNPEKIAHLSWVRAPIEKYIERCKQAMVSITGLRDRINNPPTGAEPVWFINQNEKLEGNHAELNGLLSGVSCALSAVSSTGGYALASEIRTLGVVAMTMSADDQDKALLAIQSALNVLPSYISMVIDGAHDSPGVLLKYINELRGLRDVPSISDDSALPLNLTFRYKSPPLHENDCDLSERERVFKKAATQFCLLYTQAMKDSGEAPWIEMREHLRELQRVTNDPELGCYWWVGEAIIDVIIADSCYFPPAMTTALRVVMVATQRLPQGEGATKQSLSAAKFSNLLNALSISRKQTSTSVEVIQHFDVKQNVEESRIKQLQEQLASQSVQSITEVMPEIKPRLESAMIAFGRAVHAKHAEGFAVQSQAFDQAMRTIANIFGIFNESELSEVSFYLADMVKGVDTPSAFTPEVIQSVKTQILFLDSKLIHMQRNEAADQLQIENVTADVIDRIANETFVGLKKVSQMIATHVDSGAGPEKLLSALHSLLELANVYEFAGSLTIANILAAIVTVITDDVNEGVLGESENLTLAARALVSVEMYLQYITSNLQPPANLIETATIAVRGMGLDVSEFRIVSHSDLLSKFEASSSEDDSLDALLSEILELRPTFEELQKQSTPKGLDQLNRYSTACLRLSAAAMIKGEKQLSDLCRHSAELAKITPGRVDDPSFDSKAAIAVLLRSGETILRCLDEYSSKGKVNLFLLEAIREVAALIGHAPAQIDLAPAVPEAEPAPALRLMPEGYDPQLQAYFNEEFAEQLAVLRDYLNGDSLLVTERVCRAIHNTHGCSGSASCLPISTLFDVLESRFYALKAKADSLSSEQARDLAELLAEVELFQKEFPWTTETSLLPAWIEIAGTFTGTLKSPGRTSDQEDTAPLAAPSLRPHDAAITAAVHEPAPVARIDKPEKPKVQFQDVALPLAEPDYDLEQYDLYLFDADEVLPELQRNIYSWMDNMNDKELSISIRRNMHTLKGAASIINATGIRTLTHHMESLFDSMASGAITADKSCADLATFVLNELVTMSDAVRNREAYRTLPALNELVSNACEICRVDGEELAAVIRSSYGAPVILAPAVAVVDATFQNAEALEPFPGADQGIKLAVESPAQQSAVAEPIRDTRPDLVAEVRQAVEPAIQTIDDDLVAGDDQLEGGSRRGYRGLRNRAVGERQRLYEARQSRKAQNADGIVFEAEQVKVEPEYTEITTKNLEISQQVLSLLHRARESDRDSQTSKKKNNKGSEKIKVELQLLDNSVKLSNELKASSYRQSALFREMLLSIVALREKLSLHLMHHNKTTVLLRNFNNMTTHSSRPAELDSGNDGQNLYLERFNHLSYSSSQSGLQIEQMLQDAQDIIAQSNLMDSAFKYQSDVVASLQRDLLLSRLVLFDNERPSINGALTGALQMSQKKATLEILGADTRIDRQLLESIRDPLRHVVTNAVAHGIESEDERERAGKPATGKVTVKASRRAKSLVISVSDDGRGIDPNAIRSKAINQGLIKEEDVLSDQQVLHLITEPGFSTANALSELAGRGIGMEVVRNRIATLGGHLRITSELGRGTTIELELPLTVGSNRALVCKVSDQWFAIPTFNMVQVLDYPTNELLAIKAKPGQAAVLFENKSYDVIHLADLIAVPDLKLNSAQTPSHTGLVLVEQGSTRLAIEVERGISMPEIHVTKFEGILSSVKGIIGSTEVHDGTPALVLDVIELARLNLVMSETGYRSKLFRVRRVRRETRPLVLVVDDSNSYLKLLTRHFEGQGWEVATAHNGQDALDKLPTLAAPSLFVVDVEMPKMNGLELTERLRNLRHFDNTPIIMLTTRSNLEESAIKLGVNQFLSKPYDAAMLNEAVRAVCPNIETAGAA
ncbi:response regulator [Pseudomonas sp. MWU12-2323]|uniref:hybrid sensor histidine kinase/response regulator n=1 Tax=Pseudomonas sp. MWU12-2323 TaxID=2651296 RepID=UPI00128E2C8F|nr:response regulator [Pseudomonas sp. MWU12-2323]MPQ69265.1 response regulator [Pseudomonas sp. MWU12-2323]